MQGERSNQSSFFGMIYEELIPADHLLCKAVFLLFDKLGVVSNYESLSEARRLPPYGMLCAERDCCTE